MNRFGIKWVWCVLACLGALIGCSPSGEHSGSGGTAGTITRYPIQAVATVGMVADLVRHVGGEHLSVTQIMGAGVDPHLYKATRDDVQTIMSGDVVFYCGLMLEGKMSDTLVKVGRTKAVFAVTELIDEASLLEPEAMAGHYDPHVWMDVAAWSQCVDAVAGALQEIDPPHADDYRRNAQQYREQLRSLHEYGVEAIGTIPADRRVLITSHDAFNYFGRRYNYLDRAPDKLRDDSIDVSEIFDRVGP